MIVNHDNFIKELKCKNPKALDFIVDNFSNLVFKIAANILSSNFHNQYAEDCVNDVFWSVWNNIDSFDEEKGNFKYWITAVTKYKAIDYSRKLFKEKDNENIDNFFDLRCDFNTEKIVISKENKKEVLNAINKMKPEDKEIFIRRYFLNEKIDNIAKIFGMNRNSVDKRLSRGRKFLKETLMPWKGELI